MAGFCGKSVLFLLAILAIPISIFYGGMWPSPVIKPCQAKTSFFETKELNFEGECFFRDDYMAARQQFLYLAKRCGAEMIEMPVVDEYTTDVAIFKGSPKKYVIHMSGTHGVEGFAGSAIQAAYIYSLCHPSQPEYGVNDEPTLIFVHAVNPWGFAHNRRVNEENVDLNRNFLSDEQFRDFQLRDPNFAGYVDLYDLFNPSGAPPSVPLANDIEGILSTARGLLTSGFKTVKTALVAGNYHFPQGLSFGGKQLSTSARNVRNLLFAHPSINMDEADKYVMIDVHTGLGPIGVDTFLPHLSDGNLTETIIEKFFPTEHLGDNAASAPTGGIKPWLSDHAKAVDSGYELTSGFTSAFFGQHVRQDLDPWHRINFVQEFGTYPSVLVAKGFVDENRAFHFGTEEQKKYYGARLKSLFYVRTKEWMRSVVRRGIRVIQQVSAV